MKLVRYGLPGAEKPGVIDSNGGIRDLSGHIDDIDSAALSIESLLRLSAIDLSSLPLVAADVRIGPPIIKGGRVICIGLNYTDHAAETNLPIPAEPVMFLKACHPTGPNDDVRLPIDSVKADWEVELGVVIGTQGLYIDKADALKYVAGYCVVNDFSERSYQLERGGQWTKGKSFPGFAPVGPWLVTADEVVDPGKLALWLEVNGTRHQNGNTANQVFDVATVVSYVSQFIELEPGDLICTGTPAGVGLGHKPEPLFLKPGDVVTLGVEGLGQQRQVIKAF
ncbi:fumarylacetoacetate hydrolase family protein [Pseudomonas sp. Irchel 3A5]|uniref:fumarylacetoacetate hydrolase family protein n=1 Tax=Pseudomonas sp. Irchel 3A5 TaxID=2008911 RepID=UPI000BA31FE5|nr:fumarylacetoacetate hydrolase family protein [Pseudomonas sp. Irchel 3A5]